MTKLRLSIAIFAATIAAVVGATCAPASRGIAQAGSCPPISGTQLHSILGLANSVQARNTISDGGPKIDYLCNGVAWNGAPPTSQQGAFQLARAGRGAGFGIEVWSPNEGSPSAEEWPHEYDELTGGFDIKGVVAPGLFSSGGWPSKHLNLASFGHQRTGLVVNVRSGLAKGLVAAIGCWWNDAQLTAACILVEEAAGKPVVEHLNAFAKIAVPKVL